MEIINMSGFAEIRKKRAFICDMDGVLYHGNKLLPGAKSFIEWLKEQNKAFLFLTNSSARSPRELRHRLARFDIDIEDEHFYSSAQATAAFLSSQCPKGSAYVIGEAGLINAIYSAGLTMDEINPDYVVVGETHAYSYETLTKAVNLVRGGARLIGTNPDVTGPAEHGIVPATGSLIAPIELATGSKAYYVGKPNPLIMRHALKKLHCTREETIIIGDRMDTDIKAGLESEIESVLVLSGVTRREELTQHAYRPHWILEGVGDILDKSD